MSAMLSATRGKLSRTAPVAGNKRLGDQLVAYARYKVIDTDAPLTDPSTPPPAPAVPTIEPEKLVEEATKPTASSASSLTTDAPVVLSTPPESFEGANDNISEAVSSTQDLRENLADSVSDTFTAAVSGASDLTDSLAESVSDLTGNLGASVTGLTQGFGDITENLSDTVSDFAGGITGGISGSVSGLTQSLGSSVNEGVGSVSKQASGALQAASGAAEDALSAVSSSVSEVSGAVTNTVQSLTSSAAEAYNTTFQSVSGTTSALVQGVESTLGETGASIWGSLPPQAQGVLAQAGEAAGGAASVAAQYPGVTAGVAGAGALALALRSFNDRYSGYAGELAPEAVLDLLYSDEPALLLDIRPDIARQKDGLAELKRGARFKAVALPVSFAQDQVSSMDSRLLRGLAVTREELTTAVHAALVANLKQVYTPLTKVVVVDKDGSPKARQLARAMRTEGLYNSYVMAGGFDAWVKGELPVTTERGITYEASAADLISDNVEAVAGQVSSLVSRLRDPQVAVPVASTTVLGAAAIYYYHITLELIGIAGLSWTLYKELSKYESPQEAFSAWGSALSKLGQAVPKKVPAAAGASAGGATNISSKASSKELAAKQEATATAAAVIASMPPGVVPPKLPPPPGLSRPEDVLARVQAAEKSQKAAAAAKAVPPPPKPAAQAPAPTKPTAEPAKPAPAPAPTASKPAAPAPTKEAPAGESSSKPRATAASNGRANNSSNNSANGSSSSSSSTTGAKQQQQQAAQVPPPPSPPQQKQQESQSQSQPATVAEVQQ